LISSFCIEAFATAINPETRLIVGWIFKPPEYPWLQNWENYPPKGKMARGLELSTQPFDVPRRMVIDQNNLWGTLLHRWLPAKSKISTRFALFFAHAPEGMKRVDDVRWEKGVLVIEDSRQARCCGWRWRIRCRRRGLKLSCGFQLGREGSQGHHQRERPVA
jgi:hypothetical protein